MSDLRALYVLRTNISGLLYHRKQTQADLASWLGKGRSWINKFLNGTREIQLKDLDRIADFFGLCAYQLFQPGVAPGSERRSGHERRGGHDRRVSHKERELRSLQEQLDAHRPRRQQTTAPADQAAKTARRRKRPPPA
jgi:transcriptional regulator with XRE-family HTH domain